MTLNVGSPDRTARLLTGRALFASPFRVWASVAAGLVLAVTGLVRFCPAYAPFGLSTSGTRKP